MKLETQLSAFLARLEEHRPLCAVLASLDCSVSWGDPSTLPDEGLVQVLFGSSEAVKRLCAFLTSAPHPKLWAQGHSVCVLLQPEPDLVLGVFLHRSEMVAAFSEAEVIAGKLGLEGHGWKFTDLLNANNKARKPTKRKR